MLRLVLASSSPRRRDILDALGVEFSVRVAGVDETPLAGESAADMVLRLAAAKAAAVARDADEVVIAADTAVVLGDRSFAKPGNETEALGMLAALSGKLHHVLTGVAVIGPSGTSTALSNTEVRFRDIDPDEALRYWHSGEPEGKAGSYAVQGLGGIFVEHMSGSYTGVVGLPVFETTRLLEEAGFEVLPDSRNER
jgi:septum formation protein